MKVYILIGDSPPDGSEVLAVYSSKEKAEKVMNECKGYVKPWNKLRLVCKFGNHYHDYMEILEMEAEE